MQALPISVAPVQDRYGEDRGVLLRIAERRSSSWLRGWLFRHPVTVAQLVALLSLFRREVICRVPSAPVFLRGDRDQMAHLVAALRSLSGPVTVNLVREPAFLDEQTGWYDAL